MNEYLLRLAEETGQSRERLLSTLFRNMAGVQGKQIYIIPYGNGAIEVEAPRGNDFTIYLAAVKFTERFPWLTDEELNIVRYAQELAESAGLDTAREYLIAHGFTVKDNYSHGY